ncbi:hypothetical protein ABZP36_010340 [Zizania latifolia]
MEPVVAHDQRPAAFQRFIKPSLAMDHTERRLLRHAAFAAVVDHRPASSAAHVKHRLTEYLGIRSSPGLEGCKPPSPICTSEPVSAWRGSPATLGMATRLLSFSPKDVSFRRLMMQEANKIPMSASLLIAEQEEHDSPPRNFPELGITEPPSQRGPPGSLLYNVLIHLDQLWDFSPPAAEGELFFNYSPYSAISGLDSPVSSEDDVPRKSSFAWELGKMDGTAGPSQLSVRDRLGGHRDRSRSRDRSRGQSPRRDGRPHRVMVAEMESPTGMVGRTVMRDPTVARASGRTTLAGTVAALTRCGAALVSPRLAVVALRTPGGPALVSRLFEPGELFATPVRRMSFPPTLSWFFGQVLRCPATKIRFWTSCLLLA